MCYTHVCYDGGTRVCAIPMCAMMVVLECVLYKCMLCLVYCSGRDTWDDRDRGASTGDRSNEHGILQTLAEVHEAHRSNSTSPPNNDQSGIYSDVQDLPPPDSVVRSVVVVTPK